MSNFGGRLCIVCWLVIIRTKKVPVILLVDGVFFLVLLFIKVPIPCSEDIHCFLHLVICWTLSLASSPLDNVRRPLLALLCLKVLDI